MPSLYALEVASTFVIGIGKFVSMFCTVLSLYHDTIHMQKLIAYLKLACLVHIHLRCGRLGEHRRVGIVFLPLDGNAVVVFL